MSAWHPASALVWLAALLFLSAFSTEPVLLLLSLCGMLLLCAFYGSVKEQLRRSAVTVLLFALANPLVSHQGNTVLFYLNGNALTVEAFCYGAAIGGMFAAALGWFFAFRTVFDTERVLALFGNILPKTALVLSGALRMLPLFRRRYQAISESQEASGACDTDSLPGRVRATARAFSVALALSLEGAVQSGDSMRARGYGLPGRTRLHRFPFRRADALRIAAALLLTAGCAYGMLSGEETVYYPSVSVRADAISAICFGILCLIPAICEGRERLRWHLRKSKT